MNQSKTGPVSADNARASDKVTDRPALLFAGQGAQRAGMGKDLAESDADAMRLWELAERASKLPLREIYWDGNEADMSDTRSLQPALLVTNYNLWSAWQKQGNPAPLAAAGHSLGELCALAAAGAISVEEAIEVAALRGKLMAEADPQGAGAMAAIVKLNQDQVAGLVREVATETGEMLVAANYNTPEQTVISGSKKAVEAACQKAKTLKGKGVPLKVSGAFHSPLMAEANKQLEPLLKKLNWRDPAFPVYSNVNAKPAYDSKSAREGFINQMVSSVQWVDTIRNLYKAGIRSWLEVSPKPILGKMIKPNLEGICGEDDTLRIDLLDSLNALKVKPVD